MTRKCNIFNDNSNVKYVLGNEINYNTEVLKSNFYDYNCAYNLLRGDINVTAASVTQLAFKNWAPFTESITKINGRDLHLV